MKPQVKVEQCNNDIVDYEVSDLSFVEGTFGYPVLTGRLKNTTNKEIGYLDVKVIFYDANGKVLGFSGTNVTDVAAQDSTSFEVTGILMDENVTFDKIANYKVIARED